MIYACTNGGLFVPLAAGHVVAIEGSRGSDDIVCFESPEDNGAACVDIEGTSDGFNAYLVGSSFACVGSDDSQLAAAALALGHQLDCDGLVALQMHALDVLGNILEDLGECVLGSRTSVGWCYSGGPGGVNDVLVAVDSVKSSNVLDCNEDMPGCATTSTSSDGDTRW